MEYYNDFLSHLNESMTKVQELLEKVTIKHNEAAISLLETCSLYNPQVLVDLTEMMNDGTIYDKYILEGEMVKENLEKMSSNPQETTEYYRSLMEELGIIEERLSSI